MRALRYFPGMEAPNNGVAPSDGAVGAAAREREFWDEHVPELDYVVGEYRAGPDPNTAAMLDALEPLAGKRVLDFACGAGITACFLAARGASVTGIDISPASIQRARELATAVGVDVDFIAGELTADSFAPESFDAVAGHYALHHVDLTVIAPIFRELLIPGGRGAFVETMGLNPLLSLSRRFLTGRGAVASYGSDDERPIDRADLNVIEMEIGPVELELGEMRFLRIFDRNVLRYRHPAATRMLGRADDALARVGLDRLSYHQVVVFTAPR